MKLSNGTYYYGGQMGRMHLALGQAPIALGDIDKNLEIISAENFSIILERHLIVFT